MRPSFYTPEQGVEGSCLRIKNTKSVDRYGHLQMTNESLSLFLSATLRRLLIRRAM
jgi:hypothetical protein